MTAFDQVNGHRNPLAVMIILQTVFFFFFLLLQMTDCVTDKETKTVSQQQQPQLNSWLSV